jgi:hypothetical protein
MLELYLERVNSLKIDIKELENLPYKQLLRVLAVGIDWL